MKKSFLFFIIYWLMGAGLAFAGHPYINWDRLVTITVADVISVEGKPIKFLIAVAYLERDKKYRVVLNSDNDMLFVCESFYIDDDTIESENASYYNSFYYTPDESGFYGLICYSKVNWFKDRLGVAVEEAW